MLPILLASAQASDNIPYVYVRGHCVAQGDGTQLVFWGIGKGTCDDVALADRALNNAYRNTRSKLTVVRKRRLRNEQRQWIEATNIKCDSLPDGTIRNEDSADCFIREAAIRIAELK
jgi:uncharacterized protein YecT (DUF1311 family)